MTTDNLATLVAYDCWALLAEAEIARVAWRSAAGTGDGNDDGTGAGNRAEIGLVPVNYAVVDGSVWFRTESDSALAREADGAPVVVEVDQVDPARHSGWSVVVRGTAQLVDVLDVPDMLVEMRVWPAGTRSVFVRVTPDQVTGRRLLVPEPDRIDEGVQ